MDTVSSPAGQPAPPWLAERLQAAGGAVPFRTYNFKENRITDHRIGFTLYQLQNALAGDLDPVIDALTEQYQIEQLAHASSV